MLDKEKSREDLVKKYNLTEDGKNLLEEYDTTSEHDFNMQIVTIGVFVIANILFFNLFLSPKAIYDFYAMLGGMEYMPKYTMLAAKIFRLGVTAAFIVTYLEIIASITTYRRNREAWVKYFLHFKRNKVLKLGKS